MINKNEIPTTKHRLLNRVRADTIIFSVSYLKRDSSGRYLTDSYITNIDQAVTLWNRLNGSVAYIPLMGDKGLFTNICRIYNASENECLEIVTHTDRYEKEWNDASIPFRFLPMQRLFKQITE